MAAAPTANAVLNGFMATTPATPQSRLLFEQTVEAVTPSATVPSYNELVGTADPLSKVLFPLVLQAGWSLRASTEKTETFNVLPVFAGDFS
jgi:hypothetical protein